MALQLHLPGAPPPRPRPTIPSREQRPGRARYRLPLLGRLRAARQEVRSRLSSACALEHRPPERFGFSFETATRLLMVTRFFYRNYFRVACHGLASLPAGPVLLVANHGSHVLSWDGAMIVTACLLAADPPRLVHGMGDHTLMRLPVLGAAARRIG